MAFEGWLLKFGNQEFPLELIDHESWKSTPNQRQEIKAWQDNTGKLHRDTVSHTRTKIEFETVDDLTLAEKMRIQSVITSSMTDTHQRMADIEYWNDETNAYAKTTVYVPDITFQIAEIDEARKNIYYKKIRFGLIEY
ncbi:MAG: hypothetical protein Q4D16_03510 [Eubacteriales bacterium]|nr:hypothetical protein [Eubacteriales bacterium]